MDIEHVIENYSTLAKIDFKNFEHCETDHPILVNKLNSSATNIYENIIPKILEKIGICFNPSVFKNMVISGPLLYELIFNLSNNHSICNIYSNDGSNLLKSVNHTNINSYTYANEFVLINTDHITFKVYKIPYEKTLNYFSLFIANEQLFGSLYMEWCIRHKTIIYFDNSEHEKYIHELYNYGFDIMFYNTKLDLTNNLYNHYNIHTTISLKTLTFKYLYCENDRLYDGEILKKISKPDNRTFFEKNLYSLLRDKKNIQYNSQKLISGNIPFTTIFRMVEIDKLYNSIASSICSECFPTKKVEDYITINSPEEVFKIRHNKNLVLTLIDKQIKYAKKCINNNVL